VPRGSYSLLYVYATMKNALSTTSQKAVGIGQWFIYIIVWKLVRSEWPVLGFDWKLWERERGVASLGLVPAKSSFGGFPSYQSENLGRLAFESTQTNRIIARIFGSIYCSWNRLGLHWEFEGQCVWIESIVGMVFKSIAILSRECVFGMWARSWSDQV